jgi:Polysaccharide lyase family 4, domain II
VCDYDGGYYRHVRQRRAEIARSMKRLILPIMAAAVILFAVGVRASTSEADGTIKGTVEYLGVVPRPEQVQITKDQEVCGLKAHYKESLIVGQGGGISNVVVFIKDLNVPSKAETLDFVQKGCQYHPHVLAFRAGSTIKIINADGILHSIHTHSIKNPPINIAQPGFEKVVTVQILKPELIKVNCDVHNWMHAWWYSMANPYFAVTNQSGHFTIRNVPPGHYTLIAWQEKLGIETRKVAVNAGGLSTVNVTMSGNG